MLFEQKIAASSQANSTTSLQQQLVFFKLHRCKTLAQLSQIHANIITNGFAQKSFIIVKLLSLYTGYNKFRYALQVFDEMRKPSTTVWNQIIKGHSSTGNSKKSLEIFNRMVRSCGLPDGHTYTYIINSCTKVRLSREGEQIHGRVVRTGFSSNVFVGTSLVDFYVKCKGEDGIRKARNVFDEMPERNVVTWNTILSLSFRIGDIDEAWRIFAEMPERNLVSWTTMIAGCAQNGRCKEALTLFSDMRRENIEFDQVTLVSVLSGCAELGDLNLGKWIHSHVVESLTLTKQPVLVSLNNSLIHMYASCGEIDSAYTIFRGMKQRTIVSWTSMMTGFAKQGQGDKALSVFKWMESTKDINIKPDEVTFLGVLCACSHSGYVTIGRHYFNSMTQTYGIEPRIRHFGCMVDLLSRAGLLNEANELVKTMPMKPNDAVWGALLGGCRIYKNVELAADVADWLAKELDPGRAAGYLVLLSNVYASAMMWHDVVSVRQKMMDVKMRKTPGRSWIQVEGSVYEFMAGDRENERESLVYEVLDCVMREARLQGYVPYFGDDLITSTSLELCQ